MDFYAKKTSRSAVKKTLLMIYSPGNIYLHPTPYIPYAGQKRLAVDNKNIF